MLTAFAAGDRAQEPEIGGGKRVGLAQLPKRDVLRRPFADAADGAQPFQRFSDMNAADKALGWRCPKSARFAATIERC